MRISNASVEPNRQFAQRFLQGLLIGGASLIACSSEAGSANGVGLTGMYAMHNGTVMVTTSIAGTGGPACAIQLNRFAIDATSSVGKIQYAAILAAFVAGKTVDITGTGGCEVWGDTETIYYFRTGG